MCCGGAYVGCVRVWWQGLESQADKDNVWHRITANKRVASKLNAKG
jgi:hypothetical protein